MGRASRKGSAKSLVRKSTFINTTIPGSEDFTNKDKWFRIQINPDSLPSRSPVEAQTAQEAYDFLLGAKPVKFSHKSAPSANIAALQKAAKEDKEISLDTIYKEGENLFLLVGDLQLRGRPERESWAAKTMKRDENGIVGGGERFLSFLHTRGYEGESSSLAAEEFRATRAIDTEKMRHVQNNLANQGAIFVTNDNYIISGNHHWAALAESGESEIPVIRMPRISSVQLLTLADQFMQEYGIVKNA